MLNQRWRRDLPGDRRAYGYSFADGVPTVLVIGKQVLMPTETPVELRQLVELKRFDEAYERYEDRRRSEQRAAEQTDALVRRLNDTRQQLKRAIDGRRRDSKELKELMEKLQDALDNYFLRRLLGDADRELPDGVVLAIGLRNQIVEHAVVLLFKTVAYADDDD